MIFFNHQLEQLLPFYALTPALKRIYLKATADQACVALGAEHCPLVVNIDCVSSEKSGNETFSL